MGPAVHQELCPVPRHVPSSPLHLARLCGPVLPAPAGGARDAQGNWHPRPVVGPVPATPVALAGWGDGPRGPWVHGKGTPHGGVTQTLLCPARLH